METEKNLIVRSYNRDTDHEQILSIFIDGMHDMWEGIEKETQEYIDKSLSTDLKEIEAIYFNRKESPKGNFWVVTRPNDTEILGMVGLEYLDDNTCELRRMSVRRSARRLSIGSLLLTTLLDFAKSQGYTKCILSTLTRMMPGRRLYEKHGFKELRIEDVGKVQVVHYEKELSN